MKYKKPRRRSEKSEHRLYKAIGRTLKRAADNAARKEEATKGTRKAAPTAADIMRDPSLIWAKED